MIRDCPTYNYWHDLITDLRKPKSWLDLANMILRRFRLILVKEVKTDGKIARWRLRYWLDVLDEIHEQGKCNVCEGLDRRHYLLVECQGGTKLEDAISAATTFCREFTVKSIFFCHNDRLVLVTLKGSKKFDLPTKE